MAAGANKAFLADPLGFFDRNVIVPHGSLQAQANGQAAIIDVNLVLDTTGNVCVGAGGQNVPIYRAMGVPHKFVTRSNAFKAYYLPYQTNKTKRMVLGTGAGFFFTDKIDGCTFAAGTTGGHSPLVLHLNKQDATGAIDQGRIDQKLANVFGAAPRTQLSLPDYISPEEQLMKTDPTAPIAKTHVTVLGIRGAQAWSFYFQRRNWLGGFNYRLIDTVAGYTQL